uniref:Uncharacterized protein n=1 Tax=Mustela putorius furo TaxID=9669 RepID=M3Z0E6_MUSPF
MLPRQVAHRGHSPEGPATRRRGRGRALAPLLPAPTGLSSPPRSPSRRACRLTSSVLVAQSLWFVDQCPTPPPLDCIHHGGMNWDYFY